jgi:heme exporter protein A
MPAMLQARQLACLRGDRLLFRKLDLTVKAGELWRIAGANGMGKTSLLRQLCGLRHLDQGEVCWQGEPIATCRERFHGGLLYLGHAPNLNDLLSPLENLLFACQAQGLRVSRAACESALQRIGLKAARHLPARLLSQGQRRRVGLARLFLAEAQPLWLLDEPFTALDVAAVAELTALLDAHCARGGAVVFSSHQDAAFATPLYSLNVEDFAP